MITKDQVVYIECFDADGPFAGETYTEVVLAKGGLEIGTIWSNKNGTFDLESSITGMSWEGDDFEDAVQMLIDVANQSKEY